MKNPSKIAHPLKNRKGTSQRTRLIEALQPDAAPIDGKTLADRLYLISEYARHIKFHEYINDDRDGEYQQVDTWTSFFLDSLPFQLAKLSKVSPTDLEQQFLLLHKELTANPSKQSLESLLGFVYDKLIVPSHLLYQTVARAENSFRVPLLAILQTSFKEPLKCFIALYNASVTFLCVGKKSFTQYMDPPWLLKVDEVYALDLCVQKVKKGKKEAFLLAAKVLSTLFYQLLSGMHEIVALAPKFIDESLRPLEESMKQQHEAHLALMFTFLELFKHFQGDINKLGEKHLDFFYKEVLKMIPKAAVPDKAHLIFEVAKHLDAYQLPKDLLLKDDKDNNKQDIQFGLDHELVIDKAQIKDLRSLSLNSVTDGSENYNEGVYMAPVANSVDGKGEKFKEDQAKNWSTLGSKYSKYIQEGNLAANEHPKARIGFVLSSPVLLLQEGKRTVTILLDCDILNNDNVLTPVQITQLLNDINTKLVIDATKTTYCINDQLFEECALSLTAKTYLSKLLVKQNPYEIEESELNAFLDTKDVISCLPIFNEEDKENLKACLKSSELTEKETDYGLFKVWFSGEKEWIPVVPTVQIHLPPSTGLVPPGQIQFELELELSAEDSAVVFYNEENLKEKFDLKDSFPLVKIELNEEVKINCGDTSDNDDPCCLKRRFDSQDLLISPYHFLKKLQLVNAEINVEVCGVKNLIVQNDENLQDVNKPIYPFGPRPKVGEVGFVDGGANFYIGSKEIFCKNWEKFWINMEWKDKPTNLQNHYEFYDSGVPFEDGSNVITNDSFKFRASILQEGTWKSDTDNDPPHDPPQYKLFKLFANNNEGGNPCTNVKNEAAFCQGIEGPFTQDLSYTPKSMPLEPLEPLTVNTRKGFARITLAGVSFQHARYAYVLAKQMMALAELISPEDLEELISQAEQALILSNTSGARINILKNWGGTLTALKNRIKKSPPPPIGPPTNIPPNSIPGSLNPYGLEKIDDAVNDRIDKIKNLLTPSTDGIPNEPYTPTMKSMAIDYRAKAEIDDMEIVHLYPFENTSKSEDIEQNPTLFPYFDDEGTLFIGIEELTPGGSLSLLFQLAEATADSEQDRAKINWHYLSNNAWVALLPDFDVISDETDGLTVSGIITIAVPEAISKIGNTVMPEGLYWIKVSSPENVKGVAETIGIHTQAAKASARLSKTNDTGRLETALEAGSIGKLVEGDFSVKKIEQLYTSFGGRKPEAEGHFYTRVSEHLKHKGRAHMIHDYEKIVLEGFHEIYKVKCISHTMGLSANEFRRDLEVAPGYVIVSVIPDLTKLKAGNTLEPKAPVSSLEKIGDYLRKKTSPFARLKVMNPRYEFVNVCVAVRLYRGKSQNFYAQKLKEDITFFLAPWFVGDTDKLAFGQEVFFSDLVGFIEGLDYVDFIVELKLEGECNQTGLVIQPLTARSILTAGEICVEIDKEECPKPMASVELQN